MSPKAPAQGNKNSTQEWDDEDGDEHGKESSEHFAGDGIDLGVPNLHAQENRKTIANPAPKYPDIARTLRLSGVVKVQVVIAADGQIKEVKVIGGHPVLVNAVQDALKDWKYAPAGSETTVLLEFRFHP